MYLLRAGKGGNNKSYMEKLILIVFDLKIYSLQDYRHRFYGQENDSNDATMARRF